MCVANSRINVCGKFANKCVWQIREQMNKRVWQMLEEMCVAVANSAKKCVWQMLEEMCVANAGRNVCGKC